MTERAICRAATLTANAITKRIAPALTPSECRDFTEKVKRICARLIRAVNRRARRITIKESLN